MSKFNRLATSKNEFQGDYKRVLCVCAGGLLRSPTAAWVFGQAPYNFNTRACGLTTDFALIPVDEVLLFWADEIVCMEPHQATELQKLAPTKKVTCLNIPDSFAYRDENLINLIKNNYDATINKVEGLPTSNNL